MYFCTYEPSNPTYYILLKHVFVFSSPTRLKSNGLKSVSKCPHFIHQNSQALSCWWYTGYDLPNIWKVIKFHGSSHHQAHHTSALGSAWDFEGTASPMLGPKWMAMPGRRWHGQGVVHGIDDETWCANLRGIEHLVLFWSVFWFMESIVLRG